MEYIKIALQLIVGLSILNVWLLQPRKNTQWRGGNASTIGEEFEIYGLPNWSMYLVGFLKVSLAIGLIVAIWVPVLLKPCSLGLAILLLGSILMHIKISDPIKKIFPSISLSLCMFGYLFFRLEISYQKYSSFSLFI